MFVALKDILTQIHVFHLETETFSAHKIADELRAALDTLIDKYMEVTLAGKRRRIELGEGFKPVHMSKPEFKDITLHDRSTIVKYFQDYLELDEVVTFVRNQIFINDQYADRAISRTAIGDQVRSVIKEKPLELYDVLNRKRVNVPTPNSIHAILFFHSDCTECNLNAIFSNQELRNQFESPNRLIIFSAKGNSIKIKRQLESRGIKTNIYVDNADQFNLIDKYTDNNPNPIIISLNGEQP